MGQPRTPTGWFVQAIALCLVAWAFYQGMKPSPTLAADRRGFDHSSTCQSDRLFSDVPEAPLTAPSSDRCVLQMVMVQNKHVELGGRHSNRSYSVTMALPWGGSRTVTLRGGHQAYDSIAVGRALPTLIWGRRLALLAVSGRVVSTSDNPDTEHMLQIVRWCGIGLFLLLGLLSFLRAGG